MKLSSQFTPRVSLSQVDLFIKSVLVSLLFNISYYKVSFILIIFFKIAKLCISQFPLHLNLWLKIHNPLFLKNCTITIAAFPAVEALLGCPCSVALWSTKALKHMFHYGRMNNAAEVKETTNAEVFCWRGDKVCPSLQMTMQMEEEGADLSHGY